MNASIPITYKYPFICCDFEPEILVINGLAADGFSYENVVKIITEINKEIKLISSDRWVFDYYDRTLANINNDNYKTDTNLLFYIFANNKVRMQITFDNAESYGFYSKKIPNVNNLAAKVLHIYYAVNSRKYKFIPFDKIEQISKKCENITVTFYEGSDETDSGNISTVFTQNYYDTLLFAKTFLNNNSIELLVMANYDILRKSLFASSFNKINYILEKFNKLKFIDREHMVVKHGFISWGLGVRNFDDIDINILNVYSDEVRHFVKELGKFINVDIISALPGEHYIVRNYQYAFLSKLYLDRANTWEYIFNPEAHGYIFGIKVFSLKWHMGIRYLIGRPKDCSEILYFNETTKSKFALPEIPEIKLTFAMKDSKSYHTSGIINVLKKYGINETEPESFKNAKKYYTNVIIMKAADFTINLRWRREELLKIYDKYLDNSMNTQFASFVQEWNLPDGMVSMDALCKVLGDSNADVVDIIDVVKKLELPKRYLGTLAKFCKHLAAVDCNIIDNSSLRKTLSELNLEPYEKCADRLQELESEKITMPTNAKIDDLQNAHTLGIKYGILKDVNKWKSYYDKSTDFVERISRIMKL